MFLSTLIPNTNTNKSNKSKNEPTIIQIYESCRIDFTKEEIIKNIKTNANFPIVLYEELPEYDGIKLGIWNMNVMSTNTNSINCLNSLLNNIIYKKETNNDDIIMITIDLSSNESKLNELSLFLILNDILDIQGVSFGNAEIINPIDIETNLLINVIMPEKSSIREEQLYSLLYYFIVKYCYELNCTLCFIPSDDDESKQSITQLRHCLVSKSYDNQVQLSSFYAPNSYDKDVIFHTLKRNASCEDWDASTSLFDIIKTLKTSKEEENEPFLEDEDVWLKRIQSSVKDGKKKSDKVVKKKETGKEVINFFSNLC